MLENAVLIKIGGHREPDYATITDLDEVPVPDPAVVLPDDLLSLADGDVGLDLGLGHSRLDVDRFEYIDIVAYGPS